jgi:hypothetical protein
MAAASVTHAAGLAWLVGSYDHDAEVRGILGRAIPLATEPDSYVCMASLSPAAAERNCLARLARLRDESRDPFMLLSARHLGDAAPAAQLAEAKGSWRTRLRPPARRSI